MITFTGPNGCFSINPKHVVMLMPHSESTAPHLRTKIVLNGMGDGRQQLTMLVEPSVAELTEQLAAQGQ